MVTSDSLTATMAVVAPNTLTRNTSSNSSTLSSRTVTVTTVDVAAVLVLAPKAMVPRRRLVVRARHGRGGRAGVGRGETDRGRQRRLAGQSHDTWTVLVDAPSGADATATDSAGSGSSFMIVTTVLVAPALRVAFVDVVRGNAKRLVGLVDVVAVDGDLDGPVTFPAGMVSVPPLMAV